MRAIGAADKTWTLDEATCNSKRRGMEPRHGIFKSQEQQRSAETGAVNDSLKIGVRPATSERATQALSFSASEVRDQKGLAVPRLRHSTTHLGLTEKKTSCTPRIARGVLICCPLTHRGIGAEVHSPEVAGKKAPTKSCSALPMNSQPKARGRKRPRPPV
jgi:hypothetical protein